MGDGAGGGPVNGQKSPRFLREGKIDEADSGGWRCKKCAGATTVGLCPPTPTRVGGAGGGLGIGVGDDGGLKEGAGPPSGRERRAGREGQRALTTPSPIMTILRRLLCAVPPVYGRQTTHIIGSEVSQLSLFTTISPIFHKNFPLFCSVNLYSTVCTIP